jgi:SAM-dependent methyltransferase
MHSADYALQVFHQHFARRPMGLCEGIVLLEIGPGDSLTSAVIGAAHGATHIYLVDSVATDDLDVYREAARTLRSRGFAPPNLEDAASVDDLLCACRASYGTQGLVSLREIPTASVDFIWSHAVLEHLRRDEFDAFAREMRRVLRAGGRCSHLIDLKDHLGGALNNMRIPSRWWEAEWMARSGFYTNRLRKSEMIRAFESAGFVVEVVGAARWETMPTARSSLAKEFQGFDLEELLVKEFDVLLN